MINTIFWFAENKNEYNNALTTLGISDKTIVFIKDTGEIYLNNRKYGNSIEDVLEDPAMAPLFDDVDLLKRKINEIDLDNTWVKYSTQHTLYLPAENTFILTTIPTLSQGDYLWTLIQIAYTNGTVLKSYSVSRIGADGTNGSPGATGPQGPRGPQGPAGSNGVDGKDGKDGKDGRDGRDGVDGVNGKDGKDGTGISIVGTVTSQSELPLSGNTKGDAYIIGINLWVWNGTSWSNCGQFKGTDGLTSYIHIAFTNGLAEDNWIDFTVSAEDGDVYEYIGTYTDFTQADSQNPTSYTWTHFKGRDGVNGTTTYTWIRYADSITYSGNTVTGGTGMSDHPYSNGQRKKYIGFAYNKTTEVESNSYSDYKWTEFVGTDGTNGINGQDGTTFYTWIKYADTLPTSISVSIYDTPTENTRYIGIATNKTSSTESSNFADYKWSKFRGDDGVDGKDGTGVTIAGTVSNVNLLPGSATTGTGYLINGDLYIWDGSSWNNVGKIQGPAGTNGSDGLSAYQLAVNMGFKGSLSEWLNSLKGLDGATGSTGPQGPLGPLGPQGQNGSNGKSAYQLYLQNVPSGTTPLTEVQWLDSLHATVDQNILNSLAAYDSKFGKIADFTLNSNNEVTDMTLTTFMANRILNAVAGAYTGTTYSNNGGATALAALYAELHDSNGNISGSKIVTAVNNAGSSALISANHINFDGYSVFTNSNFNKLNLVTDTQTVYKSVAANAGTPDVPKVSTVETWVSDVSGAQNTWTAVRPQYNSSYPNLYIAILKKYKKADGSTSVSCSTPYLDNTTTVIDGSKITTGTISANRIDASDLHVSAANIDGSITATSLAIKNANQETVAALNSDGSGQIAKSGISWTTSGGLTLSLDFLKSLVAALRSGASSNVAGDIAGQTETMIVAGNTIPPTKTIFGIDYPLIKTDASVIYYYNFSDATSSGQYPYGGSDSEKRQWLQNSVSGWMFEFKDGLLQNKAARDIYTGQSIDNLSGSTIDQRVDVINKLSTSSLASLTGLNSANFKGEFTTNIGMALVASYNAGISGTSTDDWIIVGNSADPINSVWYIYKWGTLLGSSTPEWCLYSGANGSLYHLYQHSK